MSLKLYISEKEFVEALIVRNNYNENLKEIYFEIKDGFGEYGPIMLMGFKTPQGVEIPRLKILDKNGDVLEVLTGPMAMDELNKRALAYKESKTAYEVLDLPEEQEITNTELQINISYPNHNEENYSQASVKTDCMYGRCLSINGIYSCPFLANDYRGRVGYSFKNFSESITAETDFCATCSKNNNFIFTIG